MFKEMRDKQKNDKEARIEKEMIGARALPIPA
jgi:hypothetical protein